MVMFHRPAVSVAVYNHIRLSLWQVHTCLWCVLTSKDEYTHSTYMYNAYIYMCKMYIHVHCHIYVPSFCSSMTTKYSSSYSRGWGTWWYMYKCPLHVQYIHVHVHVQPPRPQIILYVYKHWCSNIYMYMYIHECMNQTYFTGCVWLLRSVLMRRIDSHCTSWTVIFFGRLPNLHVHVGVFCEVEHSDIHVIITPTICMAQSLSIKRWA